MRALQSHHEVDERSEEAPVAGGENDVCTGDSAGCSSRLRGCVPSAIECSELRMEQRLDRAAGVHRAVALRNLVERQGQVEDLARVDLPIPDEVDERGAK